MARTIKNRGATAKIMLEFEHHPGMILYRKDLAGSLELSEDAIRNAVTYANTKMHTIETVVAGQAWRYIPNHRAQAAQLFELIGESKSGIFIIQSDDGRLFKATEIE